MDALALGADDRDLIRSLIIADPSLVLDDDQVMRNLVGETRGDRQVVDLRDRLVDRLETRLEALVHQQRSIIAAAYENVAGTNQLHRAVLALVEPPDLAAFLRRLTVEVPQMLQLEETRLCIEMDVPFTQPATLGGIPRHPRVLALPSGTIAGYLALEGTVGAAVVLRPTDEDSEMIFGDANPVRSEALIYLDLGGMPGMLALGSADRDKFDPSHATDLLTFFGGVVERCFVRHLADHLPE